MYVHVNHDSVLGSKEAVKGRLVSPHLFLSRLFNQIQILCWFTSQRVVMDIHSLSSPPTIAVNKKPNKRLK